MVGFDMKPMLKSAACVAAVFGALAIGAGAASATPLVNITVDPAAAGLTNTAPQFTFNGVRTSDFSSINLTATAGGYNFTEIGYLPVASFDPGNFTPPGLNGTAGSNPYGLYFAFTATGTLANVAGNLIGSFSTLNYTLNGDPGFNTTFDSFNAQHQVQISGNAGDVTLASGTLAGGGTNTVSILSAFTNPLPSAFVDLKFSAPSGSTFFVAPPTPFDLLLDSQFSNTTTVINSYTSSLPPGVDQVVTIGIPTGGGGVGGSGTGQFTNLPVPEPASMIILGSGLLGLGFVGRRRKS